jgi:hypothetical protein
MEKDKATKSEQSCVNWAKKMEDKAKEWGSRTEKDWDKKGEEWGKNIERNCEKIGEKADKPAEYIVNILINILLFYVFSRLETWLPFLTDSFSAILPLFYISIGATIIANFVFLFFGYRLFVGLTKAALNIWSIIVLVSLYYIFPFDFSAYTNANWELIVKIFLMLVIFGTAIAAVVEIVKGFFGVPVKKSKN